AKSASPPPSIGTVRDEAGFVAMRSPPNAGGSSNGVRRTRRDSTQGASRLGDAAGAKLEAEQIAAREGLGRALGADHERHAERARGEDALVEDPAAVRHDRAHRWQERRKARIEPA